MDGREVVHADALSVKRFTHWSIGDSRRCDGVHERDQTAKADKCNLQEGLHGAPPPPHATARREGASDLGHSNGSLRVSA